MYIHSCLQVQYIGIVQSNIHTDDLKLKRGALHFHKRDCLTLHALCRSGGGEVLVSL